MKNRFLAACLAYTRAAVKYIRAAVKPTFFIGIACVLVAVGAVVYMQRGSRVGLTGKVLKLRTAPLDEKSSIVVLDFRFTNPSSYPFVVRTVTVLLEEKDGKSYISDADLARFFPGEEKVPMRRLEVRAPRGSMTFWYSATAHQSCTGKHVTNGCVFDGSADPRFVVYAAYIPRHLVTKKDADKFRQAMKEMRCTSHWPGAGQVTLFAKTPHLYSKEAVEDYKALEARLDVPLLQFDARERELVPV